MALPFQCVYQGSPAVISPPSPGTITVATTGGTIAASQLITFSVSALIGTTETLATLTPSTPTVSTGAGTATNTATTQWPAVYGATSYNVYASAGGGTRLKVGNTTNLSYTWTGNAGSGAEPSVTGFGVQTLYTVPTGKTALVLGIVASNPTSQPFATIPQPGSTGALYLFRVPATGPNAGVAQPIISGTPVPTDSIAGQPLDLSRKHALAAGDVLSGYVTVPGIILTVDALVG